MRLIDAERLRANVFKASMDEHFMPMKLLDCDTVTEIIDTAPTIEERKTGKWKKILIATVPFTIYGYECPFCEFRTAANSFNYCPHCGEKMEVDE